MNTVKAKIGSENYQIELTSQSGNSIIADEPIDLGGLDSGLNPKELLNASLAACTMITLQMYASHKGWDLKEVQVSVDLLENKETKEVRMVRHLTFVGDLDEKQRERLKGVANACPIHKLLSAPILMETVMEESH